MGALIVTVLGEIPDRNAALTEVFAVLTPGSIPPVTKVIVDSSFQRRGALEQAAVTVGFRETACFGNRLASTLHLEKPSGT